MARVVPAQLKTFKRFGINYDLLVYQHDIVNNHLWDNYSKITVKKLITKPDSGEHAAPRLWNLAIRNGKIKILVRSNGLLTIGQGFGICIMENRQKWRDAGYEKRLLPIDKHVNIIDERQSYPQAVINHVMERLGYEKEAANYTHLGYGTVKLSAKSLKQMGFADQIGEDEKQPIQCPAAPGSG